ncbi:MAG: DNA-directed RNA polymerase subunit omega [Alphaproteobacteria bacterium]|nr:DNA-directed RNA polymerase subunit omega [Alphaproteobacteria bacterium]
MARITVEDCLENVPNRFSLVLVAAERTKQLVKGEKPLLDESIISKNKEVVTALREIAAGAVLPDLSDFDENLLLHGMRMRTPAPGAMDQLPPEVDDDLPPEID